MPTIECLECLVCIIRIYIIDCGTFVIVVVVGVIGIFICHDCAISVGECVGLYCVPKHFMMRTIGAFWCAFALLT